MKIGVLLSGCGVYDGAEIHEAVLTLLAIGHKAVCCSINALQHHVINHLSGDELQESRNILVESARIARGNIQSLDTLSLNDIDALVIPGGFGSAKNFSKWAFDGPEGAIRQDVKELIVGLNELKKPIAALCVSPVLMAKAFQGSGKIIQLTIGSSKEASPYTITDFENGLQSVGAKTITKNVHEILIDEENRIVTAPCYMMEASITELRNNIKMAIEALVNLTR